MRLPLLLALVLLAGSLAGCRGMRSEHPPIHPNLNMDFGEHFQAQEANPFFENNMAMRPPVPGTVARAQLRTTENAPYYQGRTAGGGFVNEIPMAVTSAMLERGAERYQIYCAVCHGDTGDGQGIIMVGNAGQGYGYVPAPTFHSERLRDIADGYLYSVITNGIRSMPGYGHQLSVDDRWAVMTHVRALQRAQAASTADVPETERVQLQNYNPNVSIR